MTVDPQPWPPGSEPDVPDADLGTVKPDGEERARDWLDQHPGLPDAPPAIDPGPLPGGPPVASFTWSPPAPSTGTNTTFDASASVPGDPEVPITNWDWLMNNSVTRSGQVVTWRLPSGSGDYPVQLTVTDAGLQTGTETQVLSI